MKINNEEEARLIWLDSLERELSPDERAALADFLEKNPEVQLDFEEGQALWSNLEMPVPEPSENLDGNFYAALYAEQSSGDSWYRPWRIAAAIGFLVAGFFLGRILQSTEQHSIKELSNQVNDLQEMMLLTLIDQPSAQDRLRAVNISEGLSGPDQKVIEALSLTLKKDQNVNVRLAALDALVQRADKAVVREVLVEAISFQDNPLLQVSIADAMVSLQIKNAKAPLRQMMENSSVDPIVREKIKQSLSNI